MIDENCVIYRQGKGYCWCPSSAWNLKDRELCQLCQVKNAEIIEKVRFYKLAQTELATLKIR